MSERGVFAVDRGIWGHHFFAPEPFTEREAWIWMISTAAWKAKRVRVGRHVVDLERGELAFSTRFLAKKFKWPHSRLVRYIGRLETDTMVSTSATREATRLTICNYNKYAFDRNTDETPTETPTGTLAEHPRNKDKEGKKVNKKEPPVVPLKGDPAEHQSKAEKVAKPKRSEKRRTQWPEGFALNDEMRAFAAERGWPPQRQDLEFEKFHQHALQNGRLLKDWVAGWRSWVLTGIGHDQKRGRAPIPSPAPAPDPTSIDWNSRVEKHNGGGIWPIAWGPQPGSAGCRAPPCSLATVSGSRKCLAGALR
jgi:hypothetical protein